MSLERLNEFKHLPVLEAPFRNAWNHRYSKALFYEQWTQLDEKVCRPPFTLNSNIPGLINFGRQYVNDADPSGYTTAMKLLGEFSYFEHLMKVPWFRDAKAEWDREIEAKLYAEGLKQIREAAKGEDAKALQAAKFLANKEFNKGVGVKPSKRGRPSNEEVEGEIRRSANELREIEDDARRIGLVK